MTASSTVPPLLGLRGVKLPVRDIELTRRWYARVFGWVAMTVKDTIETAGLRTTAGAPELAGHVPTRDAEGVSRLRAAGAVIFGRTNTPPFAADYQTNNPLFGRTTNPWDRTRTPGGSAGGAAAALAAGHTGLELGSDLAGSIRIPAANCAVCGLKPSYGLVPTRGHIPPPPGELAESDLATLGPLGRGVDDLALALDILAGPDARSALAWQLNLPAPRHDRLADYRIAVLLDDPYCPVDSAVLEVLTSLLDTLRTAGARIEQVQPPAPLSQTDPLFQQTLAGVTAPFLPAPNLQFLQAVAEGADPSDTSALTQWARWSDQPAVAVPAGLTDTGLPVGVQVVAPYLEDRTAIDFARHIEATVGRFLAPQKV